MVRLGRPQQGMTRTVVPACSMSSDSIGNISLSSSGHLVQGIHLLSVETGSNAEQVQQQRMACPVVSIAPWHSTFSAVAQASAGRAPGLYEAARARHPCGIRQRCSVPKVSGREALHLHSSEECNTLFCVSARCWAALCTLAFKPLSVACHVSVNTSLACAVRSVLHR